MAKNSKRMSTDGDLATGETVKINRSEEICVEALVARGGRRWILGRLARCTGVMRRGCGERFRCHVVS